MLKAQLASRVLGLLDMGLVGSIDGEKWSDHDTRIITSETYVKLGGSFCTKQRNRYQWSMQKRALMLAMVEGNVVHWGRGDKMGWSIFAEKGGWVEQRWNIRHGLVE